MHFCSYVWLAPKVDAPGHIEAGGYTQLWTLANPNLGAILQTTRS